MKYDIWPNCTHKVKSLRRRLKSYSIHQGGGASTSCPLWLSRLTLNHIKTHVVSSLMCMAMQWIFINTLNKSRYPAGMFVSNAFPPCNVNNSCPCCKGRLQICQLISMRYPRFRYSRWSSCAPADINSILITNYMKYNLELKTSTSYFLETTVGGSPLEYLLLHMPGYWNRRLYTFPPI